MHRIDDIAVGDKLLAGDDDARIRRDTAQHKTGRRIVDLYRQRLWAPLDLNGIFLPCLEEPAGIVAMARSGSLFSAPLDHMSRLSIGYSAFGLFATASTVARWGRQLFDGHVISDSMPEDNPGSLKKEEYADVIAYLLKLNNFPAGADELPSDKDALSAILMEKP